jgi:hypothetical protein
MQQDLGAFSRECDSYGSTNTSRTARNECSLSGK